MAAAAVSSGQCNSAEDKLEVGTCLNQVNQSELYLQSGVLRNAILRKQLIPFRQLVAGELSSTLPMIIGRIDRDSTSGAGLILLRSLSGIVLLSSIPHSPKGIPCRTATHDWLFLLFAGFWQDCSQIYFLTRESLLKQEVNITAK